MKNLNYKKVTLWVVGFNFSTPAESAGKIKCEKSCSKLRYEHDDYCDLHSKIVKPFLVLKSFVGTQKHAE